MDKDFDAHDNPNVNRDALKHYRTESHSDYHGDGDQDTDNVAHNYDVTDAHRRASKRVDFWFAWIP